MHGIGLTLTALKVPAWIRALLILTAPMAGMGTAGAIETEEERAAMQRELDQACDEAREAVLGPMREEGVRECLEKGYRPDRESCERYYADLGSPATPLGRSLYELPACVKAFEFQRSYRADD